MELVAGCPSRLGTRSTIDSSIKTNIARDVLRYRPSQNVFNWNINFISMTSHYTTTTVELRSVVVARNLCKFAFKVIKLIQVFFPSLHFLCYVCACLHYKFCSFETRRLKLVSTCVHRKETLHSTLWQACTEFSASHQIISALSSPI